MTANTVKGLIDEWEVQQQRHPLAFKGRWAKPISKEALLNSPRVGIEIVEAFVGAKLPFPASINVPILRDAYYYFRMPPRDHRENRDRETAMYWDVCNEGFVCAIKALLLCSDITLEGIAKYTHDLEALKIYETLFFNIRDRMDDPQYVAHIAFGGQTRFEEFKPAHFKRQDIQSMLFRAALQMGAPEVLYMSALSKVDPRDAEYSHLGYLEAQILKTASRMASYGYLNSSKAPAIRNAKGLVNAAARRAAATGGVSPAPVIPSLEFSNAMSDEILRTASPSIREELQKQRAEFEKLYGS